MTVTLKPVLEALGYSTVAQQRAMVKLLQASGSFGQVEGAGAVLEDRQADAILNNVTFNDLQQAAKLLHEVTQEHMIRRPKGVDRSHCIEPEIFKQHRPELLGVLKDAGMLESVKPAQKYYDHVLVLGSVEADVDKRLDTLKGLWDQGVRFGKIHLLGSERPLIAKEESSAGKRGPNGSHSRIEMDMMEAHYYAKSANWPKEMQDVRVFEVNTHNKAAGVRANTKDTIESWSQTQPEAGNVLVISSQPYVKYQDAAVKSVLPRGFTVETVGDAAPRDLKISLGMDTIARQIDVGFAKLQERLKMRKPRLEAQLVLIDPKDILVDAPTYQFRSGGDHVGVTEKGRFKVDRWDPVMFGDPIMVHERLDGRVFVADGHHRLDLAKKLNEKGAGPGKLSALVLREADGYSPQDVKIIAAYKNIADGKTCVVDTARVFKEAKSGKVNLDLLPHLQMDKGNLRLAYTMSGLSDQVLDSVKKGEISSEVAAKLAERVPDDEARQNKIMAMVKYKLAEQAYPAAEPSKATKVQLNVSGMPQEKALSGFAGKLAAQRAKGADSLGLAV